MPSFFRATLAAMACLAAPTLMLPACGQNNGDTTGKLSSRQQNQETQQQTKSSPNSDLPQLPSWISQLSEDFGFTLLDAKGQVVEGVTSIVYVKNRRGAVRMPAMQPTDSDGQTSIKSQALFVDLEIGPQGQVSVERSPLVVILFQSPDKQFSAKWVFDSNKDKLPKQDSQSVHLQPNVTIEGMTVDFDSDQPVAGAKVVVYGKVHDQMSLLYDKIEPVVSGERGQFRLPHCPTGISYSLKTEHPDYETPQGLAPFEMYSQNSKAVLPMISKDATGSRVIVPDVQALPPEEAFQLLEDAYTEARDEFYRQLSRAKTTRESGWAVSRFSPAEEFQKAMMMLADRSAGTDIEPRALAWCCALPIRTDDTDLEASRNFKRSIAQRLLDDHIDRPELAGCVDSLVYSTPSPLATCRRLQLENSDPQVQAHALRCEIQIARRRLQLDAQLLDQQRLTGEDRIQGTTLVPGGEGIPFEAKVLPKSERESLQKQQLERLQVLVNKFGDQNYLDQTYRQWAQQREFEIQHLQIGSIAPEIVGQTHQGQAFQLSDCEDKIVIVFFWGSWCGPCHALLPELNSLSEQYPEQLVIIGIMNESEIEVGKHELEKRQLKFPNIIELEQPEDEAQPTITQTWGVDSWPTTYILDRDGRIQFNRFVRRAGAEEIRRRVEWLLKTNSGPE